MVFFFPSLFGCFYHEKALGFVKCLFCFDADDHVMFFVLSMWSLTLINLEMLSQSWIPGINLRPLSLSQEGFKYILYLGRKTFSGGKSPVVSDPTLISTPKQERILKPQLPGDIRGLVSRMEFVLWKRS